ncbi:MAG TPA: biopolymer transporter ExbD [Ginsengibacter sp.]|nr:biopolymer transporter ExbD [Ginsengibacter sp.]HRP45493.1 biopolymer transporter ExbD [Ginsengibacter sp.]
MAEMEVKDSGGKKGPGVKKSKKASTRVDLTPMVDLGFLLITFFIFTTTMSQPTSMNLNMPKDTEKPSDDTKVKESGSLTIMLGKADVVYYYYGNELMNLKTTNYKDIRDIIMEKKRNTLAEDLYIIIKPDKDASYKNVVDLLDEMNICDISRYAMLNPTDDEYMLIQKTEQASGIK